MGDGAFVRAGDLWPLLLHDVRYSMHRRSMAPSSCRDHLRAYARHLTRHQIEQIAREVDRELRIAADHGYTVGDDCDHLTWMGVVRDLRELLRESKGGEDG